MNWMNFGFMSVGLTAFTKVCKGKELAIQFSSFALYSLSVVFVCRRRIVRTCLRMMATYRSRLVHPNLNDVTPPPRTGPSSRRRRTSKLQSLPRNDTDDPRLQQSHQNKVWSFESRSRLPSAIFSLRQNQNSNTQQVLYSQKFWRLVFLIRPKSCILHPLFQLFSEYN